MVLLDNEHFCDTIIYGNTYLSRNKIPERRDSVLSSLHIGLHTGNEKYIIQSSKTETTKNITINKTTESIDDNKVLEVTDDEVSIHSLINIK